MLKVPRRAAHHVATAVVTLLLLPLLLFWSLVVRYSSKGWPREPFGGVLFVGIKEIASNIASIAAALHEAGHDMRALRYTNALSGEFPSGMSTVTRELPITGRKAILLPFTKMLLFPSYLWSCNTFVLIWNKSFLPLNLDYLLIRLAGRRLIVMHCGSEVRYRPLHDLIFRAHGVAAPVFVRSNRILVRNWYTQWWSETCAHSVISSPNQATFQYRQLTYFSLPERRKMPAAKSLQTGSVRIVHAPSDRLIKGTDVFLQAMDLLHQEGLKFEFVLLEGESNETVHDALRDAHIVVDQPGTWPARLAIEAMSWGCCVVGGNNVSLMGRDDCPVIQFEKDPLLLASSIRALITDRSLLKRRMEECFLFWELNYSPGAFLEYLSAVIAGQGPTFAPAQSHRAMVHGACKTRFERVFVKCVFPIRRTR